MAANIVSETIALSALFQSASQIQTIARTGVVNEHLIAPLMRALVITNPKTIEEIYEPKNIAFGIKELETCLYTKDSAIPKNAEMLKIAFNILGLASALERQKTVYAQLDRKVDELREEVLTMHPNYEEAPDNILVDYDVICKYSQIYSSLLSPNFPKLIIYGEEANLRKVELQEMIRALLLSGVRASILWHQVGGKKYSLMFKYKDIIECARQLQSQI